MYFYAVKRNSPFHLSGGTEWEVDRPSYRVAREASRKRRCENEGESCLRYFLSAKK